MKHNDLGFTLVETLVALVIAVGTIVLFYQSFSTSVRTTHAVDENLRLLTLARSRLDEVGSSIALAPGTQQGREADGMTWSINVRPIDTGEGRAPRSFWVSITTRSARDLTGKTHEIELQTVKLRMEP